MNELAPEPIIQLVIACRDDNGNLEHVAYALTIELGGDSAMTLDSDYLDPPSFQQESERTWSIGSHAFAVLGHSAYVGNICNDAFCVDARTLRDLLHSIREDELFELTEAWAPLYDKWQRGEKFSASDFGGADESEAEKMRAIGQPELFAETENQNAV